MEGLDTLQFHGRRKRARPNNDENSVDSLAAQFAETSWESTASLVWKRVHTSSSSSSSAPKRSWKVCLDAILEQQQSDGSVNKKKRTTTTELESENNQQQQQRLRLRLLKQSDDTDAAALSKGGKKKKKKEVAVLDPLSRLVNDSLQQALEGTKSVQEHLDFIQSDPRLVDGRSNWIMWTTADGSNVLHAAALRNDVEATRRVLHHFVTGDDDGKSKSSLVEAADDQQQRPYQIAKATQHEGVAQLLEAHGADTDDYVYDVYCLQQQDQQQQDQPQQPQLDQHHRGKPVATNMDDRTPEEEPTLVDLVGGVGYWNEQGQLVLEAANQNFVNSEHDEDVSLEGDDDIDSNAEDYEFNDYPEENDDDELLSDDEVWEQNHRQILREYQDEDGDEEYDVQYGLYDAGDGAGFEHYAYEVEN